MKKFKIWTRRIFLTIAALSFILMDAALYDRVTTTNQTAAQEMQATFVQDCESRGYNVADFKGPFLSKKDFWHYEFYWEDTKSNKIAMGLLQFFPKWTEVWILDQKRDSKAPLANVWIDGVAR